MVIVKELLSNSQNSPFVKVTLTLILLLNRDLDMVKMYRHTKNESRDF